MEDKKYYSIRTGRFQKDEKIGLDFLKTLFISTYQDFEKNGYFQEKLGINCTDGYIPGTAGDVTVYSFKKLKRKGIFPIWSDKEYSEDEIFDLIEFLYDHISEPVQSSGSYHSWNQCGNHYSQFIPGKSKEKFQSEINDFLKDYGGGFELSKNGEILTIADNNLEPLYEAIIPTNDNENIANKINSAVLKFRRHKASIDDRRDAIRDLADVFEFLRPKLKNVLASEDENDIFNIANNFAIRHHNNRQKNNYDKPIWLSWIFYFYLSTIHASIRLINKYDKIK